MPILDFPSLHIDDEAAWTLPAVAIAVAQGETNSEELSRIFNNDLFERDLIHTLSIMCHPHDYDEVVRINHALTADELYESMKVTHLLEIDGTVPSNVAISIAERESPFILMEKMIDNDWVGHIACGYILRWIVSHWKMGLVKAASLSVASQCIEKWCMDNKIYGGRKQNITRNIWPKYKSVSHLWAAYYMMNDAKIRLDNPENFLLFCQTSQWILEESIEIIPLGRRAGEFLLFYDDCWTVPERFLSRGPDGKITQYLWSNELGAHDIRNYSPPIARQQM